MKSDTRQAVLHWAETIDSLRIVPRLFLLACFIWTVDITYIILAWYLKLPKDERGLEAAGFGSIVFLTVFGFMKLVYQTYSDSGRDWTKQAMASSTTVSTTSVTTP